MGQIQREAGHMRQKMGHHVTVFHMPIFTYCPSSPNAEHINL